MSSSSESTNSRELGKYGGDEGLALIMMSYIYKIGINDFSIRALGLSKISINANSSSTRALQCKISAYVWLRLKDA